MSEFPKVVSDRLEELSRMFHVKIGMNEPRKVDGGTLYMPFFDHDDGDHDLYVTMPALVLDDEGNLREVPGLTDEWRRLMMQNHG